MARHDAKDDEAQNTPAGAILRPMLSLAEQRRRDLAQIDELDAERAAENARTRSRVKVERAPRGEQPEQDDARPAPRRTPAAEDAQDAEDVQNTPAGAILRPYLLRRSRRG